MIVYNVISFKPVSVHQLPWSYTLSTPTYLIIKISNICDLTIGDIKNEERRAVVYKYKNIISTVYFYTLFKTHPTNCFILVVTFPVHKFLKSWVIEGRSASSYSLGVFSGKFSLCLVAIQKSLQFRNKDIFPFRDFRLLFVP